MAPESSRAEQSLAEFEAGVRAQLGPRVFDGIDGRVANRLANRDRVIDALIELVQEGKSGTIDEVVERSGVARRSVFRHFDDLSQLALAAFHRVLANSLPRMVIDNAGEGPLDERTEVFVQARLYAVEIMKPFRVAGRTRFSASESASAMVAAGTAMIHNQVSRQFAPELARMDKTGAERVVDAIAMLTSADSFEALAGHLDRSVDEILAVWTTTIRALLTAEPPPSHPSEVGDHVAGMHDGHEPRSVLHGRVTANGADR